MTQTADARAKHLIGSIIIVWAKIEQTVTSNIVMRQMDTASDWPPAYRELNSRFKDRLKIWRQLLLARSPSAEHRARLERTYTVLLRVHPIRNDLAHDLWMISVEPDGTNKFTCFSWMDADLRARRQREIAETSDPDLRKQKVRKLEAAVHKAVFYSEQQLMDALANIEEAMSAIRSLNSEIFFLNARSKEEMDAWIMECRKGTPSEKS